jgi:hypothetical protein
VEYVILVYSRRWFWPWKHWWVYYMTCPGMSLQNIWSYFTRARDIWGKNNVWCGNLAWDSEDP